MSTKKSRKMTFFRRFIYFSYFSSLILLFILCIAIVTNRQIQPVYGWIKSTRLESLGIYIAGIIVEQKISQQVDATNNPLTQEESSLFQKLASEKKFSFPENLLNARDKRFILSFPNHTPILLGRFLLLTDAEKEETARFSDVLEELYVNFIKEMNGLEILEVVTDRPHICFFKNRHAYLSATSSKSTHFHDTLGYFSPVQNCIYLFSRKKSLEGLELRSNFEEHREYAKQIYTDSQLEDFLQTVATKEQETLNYLEDETLSTLRHEGAHQLAHVFQIHSPRGFEKRWLTEGLAQYFETPIPGAVKTEKKYLLQSNLYENKNFSWQEIINSDENTFVNSTTSNRQLAYCQSWLIVRFLMQNYRQEFFNFIKSIKNQSALSEPEDVFTKLCLELKISPENFINELNHEILSLK